MVTLEEFVLFCFLSRVLVRTIFCCRHGFAVLYIQVKGKKIYEDNSGSFKIVLCNLRLVSKSCLTTDRGGEMCMFRDFLGQKCITVSWGEAGLTGWRGCVGISQFSKSTTSGSNGLQQKALCYFRCLVFKTRLRSGQPQ